MRCRFAIVVLSSVAALLPSLAAGAPTRSSPIAVAPDGHVFVVNPDANSVARLEYGAMHVGTLTHEATVGRYPRTLAVAGTYVFTAGQSDDTVWRLNQADLGGAVSQPLEAGCNPYGVAATPAGDAILVTCQGSSAILILDTSLQPIGRVKLTWPAARAIAVSSDGASAFVTHYLSEEPANDAHVSVVDVRNKSVSRVIAVAPDVKTCETQNSGQGPLNLVSSVALLPDGAPADVAGQLWIGGTQENNLSKGLFKRDASFKNKPGADLFPGVTFTPFPDTGAARNIYKASFHDITRFGIVKLNASTGEKIGKIDVDEANSATDIEFSADGTVAYVVDVMFNSFHLFNTRKGQGSDVTTLFAPPSSFGPGGAQATEPCVADALRPVVGEGPFRIAPQAQITVIDGYNPVYFDGTGYTVVNTGVEFDAVEYMTNGTSRMKPGGVPDGVGTAPIGVRLSPDGTVAYVANYLARNVVQVATAATIESGKSSLRCTGNVDSACTTSNDCPVSVGFCNHPGGGTCMVDSDCVTAGPCVRSSDCVPLLLAPATSTITGGIDTSIAGGAAILDGKILFNTAARDASVPNGVGLGQAAPLFNGPTLVCESNTAQTCRKDEDCASGACIATNLPGSVVSASHDASYVTCSTCHADFGGQDGRTWDFSQFGASLRNTMDLRGRAGFSPGTCSNAPAQECFFDAACGDGNFCRMNPQMIPPNIAPADRDRYFNPMLTVHWNGDRDEVEDFEHTFRSLMGCGDCDSAEDVSTCEGCLIQRSRKTSTDPVDVNDDLGAPNRNIRGHVDPSKIVGIRLSHMADFVYSLTEFPKNPNPPTDEAAVRGAAIFNDPQTQCASCHTGGPGVGKQFFTDKKPNPSFDPSTAGAADHNNPFVRHDVGTGNLFDEANPRTVAFNNQTFQNPRLPIPGDRGFLGEYITPVLNDVWHSAPYLHDGTAHALLDVVRPCNTQLGDCLQAGRGRNINDQHGVTSILTPRQLNDLVAFQKTLSLTTVVGGGGRVVNAGTFGLTRAVLRLPKQPKRAGKPRKTRGSFDLAGTLSGGILDLTPGTSFTLAAPGGEQFATFDYTFTSASASKLTGKSSAHGGGKLTLRMRRRKDGTVRFTVAGRKIDVSMFDTRDRGMNPEITVAFEIGDRSFVGNRALKAKKKSKTIFQLPKLKG